MRHGPLLALVALVAGCSSPVQSAALPCDGSSVPSECAVGDRNAPYAQGQAPAEPLVLVTPAPSPSPSVK